MDVQLRETFIELPTQRLYAPSENPALFGEGFRPFPYPARGHADESLTPVQWKAVEIENEYLKLVVLPEMGGRVAELYDKLAGRDIFMPLRQAKVDFSAVSGGYEPFGLSFHFPAYPSPVALEPVNCLTRRYSDGSASIVLGGTERLGFMNWSVELRLYIGLAYLEQSVEVVNPTDEYKAFSWWNTAAVPYAKGMRMVCPFDWRRVPGGEYEKWPMDGFLDSSNPSCLPDGYGTSARQALRDCFGAYYPGWDFGSAHCAPRKRVRGMGFEMRGGEYALLRTGPFESSGSILPHGMLSWKEYWFGVRGIGQYCQASRDVAVAVERNAASAVVRFSPNARFDSAAVRFSHDGQAQECTVSLSPESPSAVEFPDVGAEEKLTVDVLCQGRLLASLGHEAGPCGEPPEMEMTDEQDMMPGEAAEYCQDGEENPEALIKLGRLYMRQRRSAEAADCFERAMASGSLRSEARFLLAASLTRCGDTDRALRLFQDIPMGDPLFASSALEAAQINIRSGNPFENITLLECCINPWGKFLMAVSCRVIGLMREQEEDSGQLEEFFLAERYLSLNDSAFSSFTGNKEEQLVFIALEYARLGLNEDCLKLLALVENPGMKTALARAYCGAEPLEEALSMTVGGVFVNEPELLELLEGCGDETGKAQWLTGCHKYSVGLAEEAMECWANAYALGLRHSALLYCLGRAWYDRGELDEAYRVLHEDSTLHMSANPDSLALLCRVLRERGDIFERLELLPLLQETVNQPDATAEVADALRDGGLMEESITLLETAHFHKGGTADAAGLWSRAVGALALKLAREGRADEARAAASRIFDYPEGLNCPEPTGGRAEYFHTLGQALRLTGDLEKSREAFKQGASEGGIQKVRENGEAMRWVRLCQDEMRG